MSNTPVSHPSSVEGWLEYLASIHPTTIELGLERTQVVFERLQLDFSDTQVVTVAGTNGKGTTCALLESMALQSGRSTAVYSSPHLQDYRERARFNREWFSEAEHCNAFARVEAARAATSLTYFEFGTLAALVLFAAVKPDVLLLEVGLGGRLDATNIVPSDLAVITTIALDHTDWLGDTVEDIGREKAGIIRPQGHVIVGDVTPPHTVQQTVQALGAKALWQDRDFGLSGEDTWWCDKPEVTLEHLPTSSLPKQNISTALAAVHALGWLTAPKLLRQCIADTRLPGRCQWLRRRPKVLVDVAHNPESTAYLAEFIAKQRFENLHFVCAMLADKDSQASLEPLQGFDATWWLATLDVTRGGTADSLAHWLDESVNMVLCSSVVDACERARQQVSDKDLLVVFGSFYTVADAMTVWS